MCKIRGMSTQSMRARVCVRMCVRVRVRVCTIGFKGCVSISASSYTKLRLINNNLQLISIVSPISLVQSCN